LAIAIGQVSDTEPSRRKYRMKKVLGAALFLAVGTTQVLASPIITVGPNVNVTRAPGNQAESTISVNPANPLQLFESDTVSGVGHFSTNGGVTWANSNLSALGSSLGDVQTAWDRFGNLFLTRFGNPSPSQSVIVARSTDGGATFGNVSTLIANGADQPSIAVGANSVWVSFTNPAGQIVAAGAPVTGFNSVGAFSPLQAAPGTSNATTPGDFGDIAIGLSGQVAVVYQNNRSGAGPDTIRFNLDADGLSAGGFGAQGSVTGTNVGGFRPVPPQPNRTIDAEANLAWDISGGPHSGRLYAVYVDAPSTSSNDTNIFVRFSDNNGTTWSAPVRVNDDVTSNSQIQPAIAVDQTTGDVAVTWYDARNSATDTTLQVFGAVTDDGGLSFSPNFQISIGTISCLVDASFNCGDYDKMTYANGSFWRSWADNSNSTGDNPNGTTALDIYTAQVTVAAAEPSTLLLFASGLVVFGCLRHRRFSAMK
jgi:hypothetical protein